MALACISLACCRGRAVTGTLSWVGTSTRSPVSSRHVAVTELDCAEPLTPMRGAGSEASPAYSSSVKCTPNATPKPRPVRKTCWRASIEHSPKWDRRVFGGVCWEGAALFTGSEAGGLGWSTTWVGEYRYHPARQAESALHLCQGRGGLVRTCCLIFLDAGSDLLCVG